MRELDDVDRALLAALRDDARLSIRALAERVHVSRSTVHARLQALHDAGVITGYHAQIDLAKAGLPVRAIMIVDTGATPTGWDLEAAIRRVPYVQRVTAIAGDIDYLLEIAAPTHRDLSEVVLHELMALPGVVSVRTHLVISESGTR